MEIHHYSEWFILQVFSGHEYSMKEKLEKLTEKKIKMIVFSKEIAKKKQNKKVIFHPLFPGYIFIYQEMQKILDALSSIKNSNFAKPLCLHKDRCKICFIDKSACMVLPDEMELLLKTSGKSGVFGISHVYNKNDEIAIKDGPLKEMRGHIRYIDIKKQMAGVEVFLFKRAMHVNLGIELI